MCVLVTTDCLSGITDLIVRSAGLISQYTLVSDTRYAVSAWFVALLEDDAVRSAKPWSYVVVQLRCGTCGCQCCRGPSSTTSRPCSRPADGRRTLPLPVAGRHRRRLKAVGTSQRPSGRPVRRWSDRPYGRRPPGTDASSAGRRCIHQRRLDYPQPAWRHRLRCKHRRRILQLVISPQR